MSKTIHIRRWILVWVLLSTVISNAQELICSAQDRTAFVQKVRELETLPDQPTGSFLVSVGKTFLGTPYVSNTLDIGNTEGLVINLQGLDCTTFVENVLAFSILLKEKDTSFTKYTSTLEQIRYRDGRMAGYASRLHYFSEWIADNAKKGLVKDVTANLGGVPSGKDRNFMTANRKLYSRLGDSKSFSAMKSVEQKLLDEPYSFIPIELLAEHEKDLQHGDIIALATRINGLDVTHTGILIRKGDGKLHLLHASSKGQVEISEQPLLTYLSKVKNNTGIIVARPVF